MTAGNFDEVRSALVAYSKLKLGATTATLDEDGMVNLCNERGGIVARMSEEMFHALRDEWRGREVGEAPRNPYGLPRVESVKLPAGDMMAGGWIGERVVPVVPGRNRRERRANAARTRGGR